MENTLPDLTDEAQRLVNKIKISGLNVKLLGGLAVWLQSPSARHEPLQRQYGDLDFIGPKKEMKKFIQLMLDSGYIEDKRFNAIHGATRLILTDLVHQRPVDVLIDTFKMCHEIDMSDRLISESPTISLADLLLSKLQVTKLAHKDVADIAALLLDQELAPEGIDLDYIVRLLGNDWGFEHTVRATLDNLPIHLNEFQLTPMQKAEITGKIDKLRAEIVSGKKSFGYKIREKIGEKLPWAEEPEELVH
jgi:hypothetical protein